MPKSFRDADASIGARLRLRRRELGLTQSDLGEMIGVSYQQVQKYEVAKNRMSAGLLYDVSKLLGVPITYFFEDASRAQGKAASGKPHKSLRRV